MQDSTKRDLSEDTKSSSDDSDSDEDSDTASDSDVQQQTKQSTKGTKVDSKFTIIKLKDYNWTEQFCPTNDFLVPLEQWRTPQESIRPHDNVRY